MIDWLTLRLDLVHLDEQEREKLLRGRARIIKINGDGEIEWETVARESIRSDSHQITIQVGADLTLCGSPARLGQPNNVFGDGDPRRCARRMIDYVSQTLSVTLPVDLTLWRCGRMDITHNYDMGGAAQVRQALGYLRHAEGGRYQVRTVSETVYWSQRSLLRSAKAYHKGPHLQNQVNKGQADASDWQIAAANRLLRLELSLRSQYWRERTEKPWYDYTERDCDIAHDDYFTQVIGENLEVTEMAEEKLKETLMNMTTEGQAMAAFRTWALIKTMGVRETQSSMPNRTWHRHKKLLFSAGLTWADMQVQNIVPLRRTPLIIGQPVRGWDDLKKLAA